MPDKFSDRFINTLPFNVDTSKTGRVLCWVRIGDIYMSRLEIEPGVATGNYFHKETRVTFYLGRGRVRAAFKQVETECTSDILLETRKQVIHVPSYVAHATKNVGQEPAILVFFSDRKLRSGDDYEYRVLD